MEEDTPIASTQPDSPEDEEPIGPELQGAEETSENEVSRARGELEVVDVNLCGRAQRRLARHARRARIPLVSRALVVDETVDVEEVAEEVLDADRERLLRLDVSSGEDVGHVRSLRPRSAALSVNTGRLVRLPRRRRRESNFSWSAAGFEAQPTAAAAPVPEPSPPEETTLPEGWFMDPEEANGAAPQLSEPGAAANGFSCIYVEPVRPGMEPRMCSQCRCPFGMGELRLGYTPCGVAADGRQFLPVWVHAFVCTRRARLAIRFDGEAVPWRHLSWDLPAEISFSPAVPLVDRNRLVDELRHLHQVLTQGPRRSQPRQLCAPALGHGADASEASGPGATCPPCCSAGL